MNELEKFKEYQSETEFLEPWQVDRVLEFFNNIQSQLDKAEAVIDKLTQKVNGYDQKKMLEDIKPLVIKHGGFQNAYTISNIISTIEDSCKYFADKEKLSD